MPPLLFRLRVDILGSPPSTEHRLPLGLTDFIQLSVDDVLESDVVDLAPPELLFFMETLSLIPMELCCSSHGLPAIQIANQLHSNCGLLASLNIGAGDLEELFHCAKEKNKLAYCLPQ